MNHRKSASPIASDAEVSEHRGRRRWRLPFRGWLLVVGLAAIAVSAVAPHDRLDWALEHVPTVALFLFLFVYERRLRCPPLTDAAYVAMFALLALHVVGAHHLYSRVPYDDWLEAVCGARPSEVFGWSRNHYDRFVHFWFGALALLPVSELVRRHVTNRLRWAIVVAIAFVAATSKIYELFEWLLAIVMSPEAADNYNGQQGDPFDAHKDMGLALLGSLLGCPFAHRHLRRVHGRD